MPQPLAEDVKRNMELELATMEQIINELEKRPIYFTLAYWENAPMSDSGVAYTGNDPQTAIKVFECAADYLCLLTDEF